MLPSRISPGVQQPNGCVLSRNHVSKFDRAIQARIAGFLNLTLPTGADGGEDFVRTQFRACR